MEELITYVRGSHIVFGGASMVFGVLALVLRKSSTQHIRSGVLFFWAMFGAFITALYLSYMKTIPFLFFVGVFSFYMALIGKFSLSYVRGKSISNFHKAVHFLAAVVHAGMLVFAFFSSGTLMILCLIFGGLGFLFSMQSLRDLFRKSLARNYWLGKHISGMVGAFIASISAFSVVTFGFLPALVQWLWPTFVLTPIIIYWQRKVNPKKKSS